MEGSSPRMRGTHSVAGGDFRCGGLIPTYAGNTRVVFRVDFFHGAHPHVCGEHLFVTLVLCLRLGSSPRMRGTLTVVELLATGNGLIPTYAGNTQPHRPQEHRSWAHPHVCGEHNGFADYGTGCEGSSPRMRGTPFIKSCTRPANGLIPTYAGNTLSAGAMRLVLRAHPHVCGEHASHRRR